MSATSGMLKHKDAAYQWNDDGWQRDEQKEDSHGGQRPSQPGKASDTGV